MVKMEIELMEGYVLVELEQERVSSIVELPDASVGRPDKGTVIQLGPRMRTPSGAVVPFPVEVGDRVLYPPYAVEYQHEEDGVQFGILRAADVVAIRK
jgi:co-chaperonin GroES (HSP10)